MVKERSIAGTMDAGARKCHCRVKRVTSYAKTQRECRDWIKSTMAAIDRGGSYESMRMTVEEYLNRWLRATKTSIRVKTYRQYAQVVKQHIVPALGSTKLRDLRPEQIQSFYSTKLDEGTSPSKVRVIHSVFHCALNRAVRWGLLGRNPASHVDKPKIIRKEMKTLTAEQVIRLLNFLTVINVVALLLVGSLSSARMASAVIVYVAGLTSEVSQLNDTVLKPFGASVTDLVPIRVVSYVTVTSKVSL